MMRRQLLLGSQRIATSSVASTSKAVVSITLPALRHLSSAQSARNVIGGDRSSIGRRSILHSRPTTAIVSYNGMTPLPLPQLRARFRSTTTAPPMKEEEKIAPEEQTSANDVVKAPKEKISLGEIRRLATLARPESKTIAISVGLVRSTSLNVDLSMELTV
jgi:hypothetical protein